MTTLQRSWIGALRIPNSKKTQHRCFAFERGGNGNDGWFQSLRQAVVGVVVGVHWICVSVLPNEGGAVLNAPKGPLPRSAESALRRSIPVVNPDVQQIQVLQNASTSEGSAFRN